MRQPGGRSGLLEPAHQSEERALVGAGQLNAELGCLSSGLRTLRSQVCRARSPLPCPFLSSPLTVVTITLACGWWWPGSIVFQPASSRSTGFAWTCLRSWVASKSWIVSGSAWGSTRRGCKYRRIIESLKIAYRCLSLLSVWCSRCLHIQYFIYPQKSLWSRCYHSEKWGMCSVTYLTPRPHSLIHFSANLFFSFIEMQLTHHMIYPFKV